VGKEVEIDVAGYERPHEGTGNVGGVSTLVWAPSRPTMELPVDFTDLDLFEVQVIRREGGPHLRAAIELISPGNKDRPSHRQAFAVKCAGYLQRGVSVVIVDVVTGRAANLHATILEVLRLNGTAPWVSPSQLYSVAYHMMGIDGKGRLRAWTEPLNVGTALPIMPLWLDEELSVPLPLEESYTTACKLLRIE
jgi:hypothetical protein